MQAVAPPANIYILQGHWKTFPLDTKNISDT